VFALPTLGYSERVPPIETNVPNVFAVNSSHIVNGTLNVNETVKLGNDFVTQFASVGQASSLSVNAREALCHSS